MKGYLLLAALVAAAAGAGDIARERQLALEREQRWTLLSQTARSVGTIAAARRREDREREASAFDSLVTYAECLRDAERYGDGPLDNERFVAFRRKLDRWLGIDDSLSTYEKASVDPRRDAVARLPPLD